jgi:ribosomal protein S12 methylthiotransferase
MTDLVRALGELGAWVRLHYVYPYPHVDEVVPLMAEGKLLPYLDVPFQHASRRILKLMKRPASSEDNLERIRRWRAICPDITIRSTFIAAFPGRPIPSSRSCSPSSPQPSSTGSAASPTPRCRARARTPSRPCARRPEAGAARAIDEAAGGDQRPAAAAARWKDPEGSGRHGRYRRRHGAQPADAPEIDGVVHVTPAQDLKPGEFATVRVMRTDVHDMWAEVA